MDRRHKRAWNFKDLLGKNFNRLTVIKLDAVKNGRTYWICKCVCGNITRVRQDALTGNRIKSCGCLHIELVTERIRIIGRKSRTHGMRGTRFYGIWNSMKNRCLNSKDVNYKNYGGRGITICDRWRKFENFRDDMYESYLMHVAEFGEDNTSIDRFPDNDGNYEYMNCKWSTRKEQCRTRRTSTKTANLKDHNYWRQRLSNGLRDILRWKMDISYMDKYLGCTAKQFRKHIKYQFTEGMTWENHGTGPGKWNLDHIDGCNNFDLSKEEDRYICFNYKNIQPLWWEDHKKKSIRRS